MTIEAKTTLLGIPVRRRVLEHGSKFRFTSWESLSGDILLFPVGVNLTVVSPNIIEISKDISALNEERSPHAKEGRPDITHHVRKDNEINGTHIPSRIPGVWTELKWSPPSLAEKMAEALWDLADKGKVEVELELFQVIQGRVGAKTIIRLSEEFRKLLLETGVVIPNMSPNISIPSYEIKPKIGEKFLREITGVSPRGLLGEWKSDERTLMTKDQHFKVARAIQANPTNDWDAIPIIAYTFQRDLTAD